MGVGTCLGYFFESRCHQQAGCRRQAPAADEPAGIEHPPAPGMFGPYPASARDHRSRRYVKQDITQWPRQPLPDRSIMTIDADMPSRKYEGSRRRAKKGGFGPGDLTEAEWRILKDMTPIERKNRNPDSLPNRTCQSSTAYPDDCGEVPHGTTCDRIRTRYQFATIHLSTVNREARLPLCHPSSTQTPPTTRRPYARSLPDHRGESDHRAVCPPMPGRRRSTSHYGG